MEDMANMADDKLRYMLDRMDDAYKYAPSGSFLKRWIPGVCKHEKVRCTHGDEIFGRKFRRRVCMVCGRALKGDVPAVCFFTGEFHPSKRGPNE